MEEDQSAWQYWWRYNKEPFLQLKQAIHSRGVASGSDDYLMGRGLKEPRSGFAPTDEDRRAIAGALCSLLEDQNPDVACAATLGLALSASDKASLHRLKSLVASGNHRKAECAVTAMGILGNEDAVDDLLHLATCSTEGHSLVKRERVPYRIRAFACYSLGLIGGRAESQELKRRVFEGLRPLIEAERPYRWDIKVAALLAVGLLDPDVASYQGDVLRHTAIAVLTRCLEDSREAWPVRAHALTALARVAQPGPAISRKLLSYLRDRNCKRWLQQSAVLALGETAGPEDVEIHAELRRHMKRGKDLQARNFCAITLGQIGGAKNRSFLIRSLHSAPLLQRPWIALGLAVLDHGGTGPDGTAAEAILEQLARTRNASVGAGFAIALGIMEYRKAGDEILECMTRAMGQEGPAGHFAVALGLLGHDTAKDVLRARLVEAKRRPLFVSRAAVALALLGDKSIGAKLLELSRAADSSQLDITAARALGLIGDRRAIRPLIEFLGDKNSRRQRFAARALGLVGDPEALPWQSRISVQINYRANVETLTSQTGGVLDLQ